MAVKYTVLCNKCKKTRTSYNDPRLRRSVIECKASCYESHYEWTYVSEEAEEGSPVASPVPAAAPALPPSSAQELVSQEARDGAEAPAEDISKATKRQAFAEEDAKERPVEKKKSGWCSML
jgi:hypothetical protein